MKKIFLTSGVILCMACPAFADITPAVPASNGEPAQAGNIGNTGNGLVYPKGNNAAATVSDISGATIADACVYDTLGVHSGSTTLRAVWRAIYNTITLNSNLSGDGTAAAPATLFASGGSLWQSQDGSGNLEDEVAEGDLVFTTTPLGDTVGYTLNYNDTTGSTSSSQDTSMTGARRPLLGFFYDDPNDEPDAGPIQMITSGGLLTADGAAADSNQTWIASWGSATPTLGTNPTRDGYQFTGWNTQQDGSGSTPGAISTDTTIYAQWSANTYNITYSCDDGNGGTGTPSQATDTIRFDGTVTWASNLDAQNCGRAGYHFTGWDCSANDTNSTVLFTNGGVTQATDDVTGNPISGSYNGNTANVQGTPWASFANNTTIACVAHYAPNTVGLTWDVDGTTTGGTCEYDGTITMPATPTKRGWDFVGWEVVTNNTSEDNNLYNGD